MSKFLSFIFSSALLFAAASMAKPDVYFTDSAQFNDVYLRHEMEGANIKFILEGTIQEGTIAPTVAGQWYNQAALEKFTREEYEFSDVKFKNEFQRMFEESFASEYGLVEFMGELNNLLRVFKAAQPASVID